MAYVPDRGDVIWINFNPQAGHEHAGHRLALVISPAAYNQKIGLAILCPITTKIKGYPFEVIIPEGLEAKGVILADQIKNLDWRVRKADFLCKLPDKTVLDVQKKLKSLIS